MGYVKVNNFEKINSFYGFAKANILLNFFLKLLKGIVFKNSLVARVYEISFGILVKNYKKRYKLHLMIELTTFYLLSSSIFFTASFR